MMKENKLIYIIIIGSLFVVLGIATIHFFDKKDDCEDTMPITNSEKCINTTDRVCEIDTKC